MTLAETTIPDPIQQLWRFTRICLADALDAFGGVSAIARLIVRGARRVAARKLAALELVVMKLLLVEAADLDAPAPRAQGARAAMPRAPIAVDLAQPETWRVRFIPRLPPAPPAPTPAATAGPRIRSLAPPLLVRDVFADRARLELHARMAALNAVRALADPARERAKAERLARRFEALRRVFDNPKPYALRLKRTLLARAREAYAAAMRIVHRRPPADQFDPKAATAILIESARVIPELVAPPSG